MFGVPVLALRAGVSFLVVAGLALALQDRDELPGKRWELAEPHTPEQRTAASLENFEQHACAECHAQIAEEWAATRHAMAWVNSVYQKELESITKPSKCHSCHAPQPVLLTGVSKRPKTRETDLHFGVDCNACHRGADDVMHGPRGTEVAAHASVRDENFSGLGSNELCLGCHSRSIGPVIGIGRDFDDAELEDAGYSCVECHMAPVQRPMATQKSGGAPTRARAGRSHLLQTPRDASFLRQAFELRVMELDGVLGLRIANRAGHRVPGSNDRVLDFTIQLPLAGEPVPTVHELQVSREEPLRVREEFWIPFGAPLSGPPHVRAVHTAKSLSGPVVFLDEDVPLP